MSEEDKKPIKLVRMPDGSMRPATDTDSDIGNIWLTQNQIRESEAKEEKLRKAKAKNQPKKRLFKKRKKAAVAVAPTVVKPTNTSGSSMYRGQELDLITPVKQASKTPKKPVVAPNGTTTKEIAISLTLPKLKVPTKHKKHVKKAITAVKAAPKWVYVVAVLVALPAFLITWGVISHKSGQPGAVQGEQTAKLPDYPVLTPDGDITNTTSQKVNYDPTKKVASYTDKIDGKEVTISMQPIPETFKPAIGDNVKKVAEGFTANTVLQVDNGAAYLGTSIKGPQSFVGYRGDLLVFMMSQEKISDKSWSDYFNTLK